MDVHSGRASAIEEESEGAQSKMNSSTNKSKSRNSRRTSKISNSKVNVEQVDFHKTTKTAQNRNPSGLKNLSKDLPKTSVSAVFPKGIKHHNFADEKKIGNKSFSKVGHSYGKIINIEELGKSPKEITKRMSSLEDNFKVEQTYLDIK